MFKSTKSVSIKARLSIIIVVVMLGLASISGFSIYNEKLSLLLDRQAKTKNLVEAVYGVLEYQYGLQSKGILTEDQAKTAALSLIKQLRYDEKEYFWVNDMIPRVLMHPMKPELDGKDVSDLKDSNGNHLFVEFVDIVRKDGAGFVSYLWPKPGQSEPAPKISYVKGFTPWGWVIGSGIYIDDIDSIFWYSTKWMIGIILVITLLIFVVIQLMALSITRPLSELQGAINDIQLTKDLTKRIELKQKNEIGEIADAFNIMLNGFQDIIQSVVISVFQLKQSAENLRIASNNVEVSSTKQSDAALSMAAESEQMLSGIESIASNAKQTHAIAVRSDELSSEGENAVNLAAEEMTKIAESVKISSVSINQLGFESQQISAIVKAIREIADQTNLLALNAAIEAARAGEQGRGFAVVADEVRKLAERTSKSTLEIATMIEKILAETGQAVTSMQEGAQRVTEGVNMAHKAGKSMTNIRDGAQEVIISVSEISNALAEQEISGRHVAEGVEKVAQMATENCSSVKEIVVTSEHLLALAGSLQNVINQFKTSSSSKGSDLELF